MNSCNVPDRSDGNFYCKICDSRMHSEDIWNSHISGKRHIKNVSKGISDSKYENLDIESGLKHELKYAKGPIVGLSYIHEFIRRDPRSNGYFNCNLCQAILPLPGLVIEHVTSMKHKLNFLKETDIERYKSIMDTQLGKDHIIPLIEEACDDLEGRLGRGSVTVKREREKRIISSNFKRVIESYIKNPERRVPSRKRENCHYKIATNRETVENMAGNVSRSESLSSLSSYERRKRTKRCSESCRRLPRHEPRSRSSSSRSRFSPCEYKRRSKSSTRCSPPEHRSKCKSCSKSSRHCERKTKSKCTPCLKSSACKKELTKRKPSMIFTEDFYRKLSNFPANMFFKLVINKLETCDMNDVDCSLLKKLMNTTEDLIRSKLAKVNKCNGETEQLLRNFGNSGENRQDLMVLLPYGPFMPENSYESDVSSILSLIEFNKDNSA